MKQNEKLKLKHYGLCQSEIIWIEGPLYKIRFFYYTGETFPLEGIEVFHEKEILNLSEIFIDENLNISKYDSE
jgi:hypothetical protein